MLIGVEITHFMNKEPEKKEQWRGQHNNKSDGTAEIVFFTVGTIIWVTLQGYFVLCGICLFCRFQNNIPPTPPPTPFVVIQQQGNFMAYQQPLGQPQVVYVQAQT